MKVIQFKQVPQKEKDDIMRKLVSILRTKDLSDKENEVVEQAEVAVADYETLKKRIYETKTIEGLTDLVKKFEVTPGSYLAQYVQRRTVWLKAFDCKNNKTTKEKVIALLNRYEKAFRAEDKEKVIQFINN